MNSDYFTNLAFQSVLDNSIKKMLTDLTEKYGEEFNFTYDDLYKIFKIDQVKKRNESKLTYK